MISITREEVLKTYKSREAGIKALSKHDWFPLRLCPKLAGIVADLIADGHLQSPEMWRMAYCSASLEELKRFNNEIKKLFNFSGYVRLCLTNQWSRSYLLAINCKPIGRVMSLCGVPSGQKVLSKFTVPSWILEDKECFRRFVQRLFDCEGCVDLDIGLELKMYKEISLIRNGIDFFEEIKSHLLKYFDIKTTNIFLGATNLRKDGKVTRAIRMKIRKQSEIIKFSKEINFETKIKQEKLQIVVQKINKKWACRDLNFRIKVKALNLPEHPDLQFHQSNSGALLSSSDKTIQIKLQAH